MSENAVMEIVPGRGLGGILFGMNESDIVSILGSPDKAYDSEGDRRIMFNAIGCAFWFRDDRLHWIRCRNPDVSIFGEKLLGKKSAPAIAFLCTKLDDSPEFEDYGEWESYTFPESWIELQFDYDLLSEVCFGHYFGDDDEPVWPPVEP